MRLLTLTCAAGVPVWNASALVSEVLHLRILPPPHNYTTTTGRVLARCAFPPPASAPRDKGKVVSQEYPYGGGAGRAREPGIGTPCAFEERSAFRKADWNGLQTTHSPPAVVVLSRAGLRVMHIIPERPQPQTQHLLPAHKPDVLANTHTCTTINIDIHGRRSSRPRFPARTFQLTTGYGPRGITFLAKPVFFPLRSLPENHTHLIYTMVFDASKKSWENLRGSPSNYSSWKLNVEAAAKTHRLWRSVQGRQIEPEYADAEDPTAAERTAHDDWEDLRDQAAGMLWLCIEQDQ
ncbi:hypothetical protein C8R46DRAFT_1226177 [Mycena filopes]|nr:hypothetical protein C8R46DRAFT_1226177 [Mycena filopes]